MYCRICGNSLKETDLTCDVCGTPVAGKKSGVSDAEVIYNTEKEEAAGSWDADSGEEPGDKEVSVIWKPDDSDGFALPQKDRIDAGSAPKEAAEFPETEFAWNVHDFTKTTAPSEPEEFVWDIELDKGTKPQGFESLGGGSSDIESDAEKGKNVVGRPICLEEIVGGAKTSITEGVGVAAKDPAHEIDKFFTFSQKSAEFQKLLDREYEKIHQASRSELTMPDFYPEADIEKTARYNKEDIQKEIEAIIETAGLKETEITEGLEAEEESTAQKQPVFVEQPDQAELSGKVEEPILEEAGTVVAEKAGEVRMAAEGGAEELETQAASETHKEEERLSESEDKSDTRPKESRQAAEMAAARSEFFRNDQEPAAEMQESEREGWDYEDELPEEDEEEDGYRNWGFGKSAIAVIAVIIILELAMLGIKYFLPESEAAAVIGDFQKNLTTGISQLYDRISGDEEEPPVAEGPSDTEMPDGEETGEGEGSDIMPDTAPMADKDALIASALSANRNIAEVKANNNLAFDSDVNYTDSAIKDSVPISDNILYLPDAADDAEVVYYDRSIVSTIIAFDSLWIDYVNNGDKAVLEMIKPGSRAYEIVTGFSKAGKVTEKFLLLEIGELRQNGQNFYAWTHERIEVTEAGKSTVKDYRWIYKLEKIGKELKIINYYKY